MPSVLVIGAGAAGLTAARHIKDAGDLELVVCERRSDFGGLWLYAPTDGEARPPADGVSLADCGATPMYRDLRTNLSKAVKV